MQRQVLVDDVRHLLFYVVVRTDRCPAAYESSRVSVGYVGEHGRWWVAGREVDG